MQIGGMERQRRDHAGLKSEQTEPPLAVSHLGAESCSRDHREASRAVHQRAARADGDDVLTESWSPYVLKTAGANGIVRDLRHQLRLDVDRQLVLMIAGVEHFAIPLEA